MRKRKHGRSIRRLFRRLASLITREKAGSGNGDAWWKRLTDGNGLQPSGRPSPTRPRVPTLSAAAAAPLPPFDEGPGIVYALARSG